MAVRKAEESNLHPAPRKISCIMENKSLTFWIETGNFSRPTEIASVIYVCMYLYVREVSIHTGFASFCIDKFQMLVLCKPFNAFFKV